MVKYAIRLEEREEWKLGLVTWHRRKRRWILKLEVTIQRELQATAMLGDLKAKIETSLVDNFINLLPNVKGIGIMIEYIFKLSLLLH